MLGSIGTTELIIILVIVLLLFGVGRIGKIGGELGSGIKSFREGLKGPEAEKKDEKDAPAAEEKPAAAEPTEKKEDK